MVLEVPHSRRWPCPDLMNLNTSRCLEKVREHLSAQRYGACARASYPYAARSFLRYLERRGWSLESVTPERLDRYVSSRRLKGSRRPYPKQFRRMHAAAIRMLLRVLCGH